MQNKMAVIPNEEGDRLKAPLVEALVAANQRHTLETAFLLKELAAIDARLPPRYYFYPPNEAKAGDKNLSYNR